MGQARRECTGRWYFHISPAPPPTFRQIAELKDRLSTPVMRLNSYLEGFIVLQSIGIVHFFSTNDEGLTFYTPASFNPL